MNALPDHLGGHMNKTHIDVGTLDYLCEAFDITSILDIGCGPGDMSSFAKDRGIMWTGLDGDDTIFRHQTINIVDFTLGPWHSPHSDTYDLAWSVEFLEHVEERHMRNYMNAFSRCECAVVTAAPPGYPGHHHVNCRTEEYWKGVFSANGFGFDAETTAAIRQVSTMKKPFMQATGMFFRKYDETH